VLITKRKNLSVTFTFRNIFALYGRRRNCGTQILKRTENLADQVLFSSDAYPGRIYKLSLEGKVLGVLGGSGKGLRQFGWIHEIACPSDRELYVSELLNWRVQKLVLSPGH
jgi:hypothetical protein